MSALADLILLTLLFEPFEVDGRHPVEFICDPEMMDMFRWYRRLSLIELELLRDNPAKLVTLQGNPTIH